MVLNQKKKIENNYKNNTSQSIFWNVYTTKNYSDITGKESHTIRYFFQRGATTLQCQAIMRTKIQGKRSSNIQKDMSWNREL